MYQRLIAQTLTSYHYYTESRFYGYLHIDGIHTSGELLTVLALEAERSTKGVEIFKAPSRSTGVEINTFPPVKLATDLSAELQEIEAETLISIFALIGYPRPPLGILPQRNGKNCLYSSLKILMCQAVALGSGCVTAPFTASTTSLKVKIKHNTITF